LKSVSIQAIFTQNTKMADVENELLDYEEEESAAATTAEATAAGDANGANGSAVAKKD